MYDFENKLIRDIHCSRYIASYIKSTGDYKFFHFKKWLRSLIVNEEHLTKDEVWYIYNFATNGKLELEEHAEIWYDKNKI